MALLLGEDSEMWAHKKTLKVVEGDSLSDSLAVAAASLKTLEFVKKKAFE